MWTIPCPYTLWFSTFLTFMTLLIRITGVRMRLVVHNNLTSLGSWAAFLPVLTLLIFISHTHGRAITDIYPHCSSLSPRSGPPWEHLSDIKHRKENSWPTVKREKGRLRGSLPSRIPSLRHTGRLSSRHDSLSQTHREAYPGGIPRCYTERHTRVVYLGVTQRSIPGWYTLGV